MLLYIRRVCICISFNSLFNFVIVQSVTDTDSHGCVSARCKTLPHCFNLYWPRSQLKGCVSQPINPGDLGLVTTLFAKKQKVPHCLVLE